MLVVEVVVYTMAALRLQEHLVVLAVVVLVVPVQQYLLIMELMVQLE